MYRSTPSARVIAQTVVRLANGEEFWLTLQEGQVYRRGKLRTVRYIHGVEGGFGLYTQSFSGANLDEALERYELMRGQLLQEGKVLRSRSMSILWHRGSVVVRLARAAGVPVYQLVVRGEVEDQQPATRSWRREQQAMIASAAALAV